MQSMQFKINDASTTCFLHSISIMIIYTQIVRLEFRHILRVHEFKPKNS